MKKIRHIDTTGLPEKFDAADLVEQGVTGQAFIDWCRARVKDGPPVLTKAEMRSPRKRKPVDIEAKKAAAVKPVNPKSNVAPMVEPDEEPEQVLDMPPEFSQDSIADEFTRKYRKTLSYCASWKSWLYWEDNRWKMDDTFLAVDLSRQVCRATANLALDRADFTPSQANKIANSISSRTCFSAVETIARSDRRHVVRPSHFDADPWILNTPGGVVNLRTGRMRKARRTDWCIKSTTDAPGGECPTWLAFLQDCTQGNSELIAYLKRVAGYCLTGSISEQKFFFIYGGGGNGKGQYLGTLEWLLNTYSRQANMDTFTEQRFTKHASEIAYFQGARLVVASETNVGQRWNESRIKSMTGGDPITANLMHKDPFTFNPTFKLLFSGNHKPHLKNVDDAIKRRLYLIPFDYKIPDDKIDQHLPEKLRDEAGGILKWAIEGCLEWQEQSLNPPAKVLATTADYFEAEDRMGAFLDECCLVQAGQKIGTTRLFERYCKWTEGMGEYTGSRRGFLDMLAVKGFRSEKYGGEQVIQGIAISYDPNADKGWEY